MEQVIGALVIFAFMGLMLWANSASNAALNDADNKNVVALHEIFSVAQLSGTGQWLITIMRQSGNVHSMRTIDGDEIDALKAVTTTFQRAGIDAVAISINNATELKVTRLFHNHRGRSEGKRVGGAVIKLASALTKTANASLTWTCECGQETTVPAAQLSNELQCSSCGKVETLTNEKLAQVRQHLDEQVKAATTRVRAGERSVTISSQIPPL